MLSPTKILGDLRTRAREAFDRADELGGDLRDYLQDRWHHDPRVARLRERVERWTGRATPPTPPPAVRTPAAAPSPAAPSTPTAAPAAATGHGDPALPAQIFGKKSCPWTGRAITVLERHKVDYDFVDLEEPEHERLALPLANETRQHTVPYVYLRGQFVGGFNALAEIERLGQLPYLLSSAEERAKVPTHERVEIAPRPNTDEVAPAERDPSAPEE